MVALHQQLLGRPLRLAARRPASAAILHWMLAVVFLSLSVGHLVGPLGASPGRNLVDAWWALELTAIWCVPAVWFLFRIQGAGPFLVGAILPLLAVTALTLGTCWQSTKLLCSGVGVFLLLAKCLSLQESSSSRRARELFAMRVLVGVLAGLLAAAAAGVALVCIREIFAPAALHGTGVTRGALLLSGTSYFATLAVLEVVMAAPERG